ncbi:hypothetical protein ACFXP7_01295 [Microbacterium sp. P06]|uniref:hypothetical protein n=1 Tax=unclassified Microbacterium TaxID=2609290 RepID=UPI003746FD17
MDRIHYSGDSILTGTKIAHALIDYAQALAQTESSDTVVLPTVREDGGAGRSEFLVGPSSQLFSDAEDSEWADPIDSDLVDELSMKAERLRQFGSATPSVQAQPLEPGEGWSELDEF